MFQKESRSLGSAPFETQAQMNDNPETALRRTLSPRWGSVVISWLRPTASAMGYGLSSLRD